MSEPMEDKRLERSVEEIAKLIIIQSTINLEDGTPNGQEILHFVKTESLIAQALQAERDKLRVVEAERDASDAVLAQATNSCSMLYEDRERLTNQVTTLQSQITALQEQNMKLSMPSGGAVDEFIQYHHNPIVGQKNKEIAALQSQITALKEVVNGASLHPETGVSLVDDVRDLLKEHERALLSRDKALLENTRLREALDKIKYGNQNPRSVDIKSWAYKHDSLVDYIDDVFAKAALEGGK